MFPNNFTEAECQCCPVGRSGHRIVATDNCLYSLGGFNPAIGGGLDPMDETPEPFGERGHPCLFKEVIILIFNLLFNLIAIVQG